MRERIRQLLADGESRAVEFKTARRALSRSLYETVCAFLNRDGGDILLGVGDDGSLQGVDPDCSEQMQKDFATTVNNAQKLNPPSYLSLEEIAIEDVTLLHAYVPPSSQVHRTAGRIFDRNEDGDLDITDNQTLVAGLYARKQSTYSENTIYPYAELADLDPKLIERVRRMATGQQDDHAWARMEDKELLQSARLFQRDLQRGQEGLTLAAILLLGKDETILSALSHHRTDAILRRVDVDRYDDRDDIRTNLLDSYDRLISFGQKHLPDPFYLEGDQRVSLRGRILREIIGNLLIHREYINPFPAKFVIENERIFTENGNKPHGHGKIDPALFSPYPKNPVIARVFKEMGLADELGSGVRRLYQYCKAYCDHDPEMVEDDIFRFILPLGGRPGSPKGSPKSSPKGSPKTEEQILTLLAEDPKLSTESIGKKIGISKRAVLKQIDKLKSQNRLKRVGPARGGHWEVLGE